MTRVSEGGRRARGCDRGDTGRSARVLAEPTQEAVVLGAREEDTGQDEERLILSGGRKSTGFFQIRSMKAGFEGFLRGEVSFATACQRLQSNSNAGNYRTFGFY